MKSQKQLSVIRMCTVFINRFRTSHRALSTQVGYNPCSVIMTLTECLLWSRWDAATIGIDRADATSFGRRRQREPLGTSVAPRVKSPEPPIPFHHLGSGKYEWNWRHHKHLASQRYSWKSTPFNTCALPDSWIFQKDACTSFYDV